MSASIPPMRKRVEEVRVHEGWDFFYVWYFNRAGVNYDYKCRRKPTPFDHTKEIPEHLHHLLK